MRCSVSSLHPFATQIGLVYHWTQSISAQNFLPPNGKSSQHLTARSALAKIKGQIIAKMQLATQLADLGE